MMGPRIAAQRKKLGMSQSELARRLCVSASAVGMYEQGRRQPSAEILAALSVTLDVSIDYLVTGRNWTPGAGLPPAYNGSRRELVRLLLEMLQQDSDRPTVCR